MYYGSVKRSVRGENDISLLAQDDFDRSRSNSHRESIVKAGSPVTWRPAGCEWAKQALRPMANGKAMGSDELPAELLYGLSTSSYEILLAFHSIILAMRMTGEVPQECKDTTIKVLYNKKDLTECGN